MRKCQNPTSSRESKCQNSMSATKKNQNFKNFKNFIFAKNRKSEKVKIRPIFGSFLTSAWPAPLARTTQKHPKYWSKSSLGPSEAPKPPKTTPKRVILGVVLGSISTHPKTTPKWVKFDPFGVISDPSEGRFSTP